MPQDMQDMMADEYNRDTTELKDPGMDTGRVPDP